MKEVEFIGDSLERVRSFPVEARRTIGFQLDRLQNGREPDDWKPMKTVGQGVREIRVREKNGAFRVLYVANYQDAIFVLHAFEKKTQTTAQKDINLAKARLQALMVEMRETRK
jgi:phage-related protein